MIFRPSPPSWSSPAAAYALCAIMYGRWVGGGYIQERPPSMARNYTLVPSELQKRKKLAPTNILTQKISTKTARFSTFLNSRQNSVKAFEIRYFYAQCLLLTSFLFNHPYHTLQFVVDNFSHHATSTSVGGTSAISNVIKAPM